MPKTRTRSCLRSAGFSRRQFLGRGVNADKPHSAVDRVQKLLFAYGGHWRVLIRAFLGQVAGGKEQQPIELVEVRGIKNAAILGAFELKAMLLAKLGHRVFEDTGLAFHALYNLMFKA